MKKILFVFLFFSLGGAFARGPYLSLEKPLIINDIAHNIIEVPTIIDDIIIELDENPRNEDEDPFVIIDKIINLGQKIWGIIEKNKPSYTVIRHYANAFPKGVKSSEELDGFSSLNFTSYRIWGVNLLGITVYDITYTLVHRYDGNYNGKGKYVDTATVLPHKVNVLWGYTIDSGIENVGVVNVGTKEKPIGSVALESWFRISTVLQTSEFRSIFEFRGDSPKARVLTVEE